MEEAQIRVCFETHWQESACSPADRLQPAITHLRNVLGDQTYESLARKGETMTVLVHTTNPDHLEPAAGSATDKPPL